MSDLSNLTYMCGFSNEFSSEDPSYPNSLPLEQNNPKKCPYGLYAEQLSGTAFTVPRDQNRRSWLYRLIPSVCHFPFEKFNEVSGFEKSEKYEISVVTPNQLRWLPFELVNDDSKEKVDFITGMHRLCGCGSAAQRNGLSIYSYSFNCEMDDKSLKNSDGDFLIVPQKSTLQITTEFGVMSVAPGEIAVIQQGMVFNVNSVTRSARGYVLEVYDGHFELPNLGPIGANGLASARHFKVPTARVETVNFGSNHHYVVNKFQDQLFVARQLNPYNVAAWHGNYVPYKYDLSKFQAINTVSYDHCDPSIFTVLTCKSSRDGVAIADFVIFPPRWSVASNTFRPPYYHRNCMSEFMGLISGDYDAKPGGGFLPGGASLHNMMTAHGPDAQCYQASVNGTENPVRLGENSLAFMFETSLTLSLTPWAMDTPALDKTYCECWTDLKLAGKKCID